MKQQIVLIVDSDWLDRAPSCCKILYKHTVVTAMQQHNYASQTSCFKMSDSVNFIYWEGHAWMSGGKRWTGWRRKRKRKEPC